MSWMSALHDTYEICSKDPRLQTGEYRLLPVNHSSQQAHIEIVVDENGMFRRASVVPKEETLIPVTEASASRTSGIESHPLADKIKYVAGDYSAYGGTVEGHFDNYVSKLAAWANSQYSHEKVRSILTYVQRASVVADLVRSGVLTAGADSNLLRDASGSGEMPPLLRFLTKKEGEYDQGDAFVRWIVERPGVAVTRTWEDDDLIGAWIRYSASELGCSEAEASHEDLCLVTGTIGAVAKLHPKRIRHPADGGKLISANDREGFTFRGRFTDIEGSQACTVGSIVSQKAHNALRWLIARQGYKGGDSQVFVSWAVVGKVIPEPFLSTFELLDMMDANQPSIANTTETLTRELSAGDVGQTFASKLNRLIAGYSGQLRAEDGVVIMGLDSATPGRIAVTYYREILGSEFLERIHNWHSSMAWHLYTTVDNPNKAGKKMVKWRIGAPSPLQIAYAAYGRRLDVKLKRSTLERILPCIVDGQRVPRDLVDVTVNRVAHRAGFEGNWDWEESLGIACALYRGFWGHQFNTNEERRYSMTLEPERATRDYLFGRLFSYAEHIEEFALRLAGEHRDTTAARLMQRFADRPSSTWRTIELALVPYKARIKARYPASLVALSEQLDEVLARFQTTDFISDSRLSGEFLLGYHCQRQELNRRREKISTETESEIVSGEEK